MRIILLLAASSVALPGLYAQSIQPLFEKNCYSCHGEKLQSAGLRMDLKSSAMAKITPGNPDRSEVYRRVAGLGNLPRMPMGGKLSDADIALISNWISSGAVWESAAPTASAAKPKHWAFVPPVRPALPTVQKRGMGAKSD